MTTMMFEEFAATRERVSDLYFATQQTDLTEVPGFVYLRYINECPVYYYIELEKDGRFSLLLDRREYRMPYLGPLEYKLYKWIINECPQHLRQWRLTGLDLHLTMEPDGETADGELYSSLEIDDGEEYKIITTFPAGTIAYPIQGHDVEHQWAVIDGDGDLWCIRNVFVGDEISVQAAKRREAEEAAKRGE